ncbi:hypothetical protein C0993_012043 [Termitomyces sp. T159_Od127]|nr:hypothetical protein C0993_012043 [Termitomyces sp. T159_Od127]
MSASANPYFFRSRTIGRAASPPTWACYEQIPYDDEYSDSGSESCSEDDEDYPSAHRRDESLTDSDDKDTAVGCSGKTDDPTHDLNMDIEEEGNDGARRKVLETQKDVKGKQRALDQEPEKSPRQRKKRSPVYTLRPILTIQRSQGFVWNQDLFVPPYIKDRYVASTSPPNSRGFISTSVSSTNSALNDYEVEVVEIRVKEGELDYIIP